MLTQSKQTKTLPRVTLGIKDNSHILSFTQYMDQKLSPQYRALHFYVISGSLQESDSDNIVSPCIFPLSTFLIKAFLVSEHYLFSFNCCPFHLELDR